MKKDLPTDWTTVPILPCIHIVETLDFWEAIGFEVTYKQMSPYQYGVVRRNGHDLHFIRIKGFDPTGNYAMCLVVVSDAPETYISVTKGLKAHLGKVPHSGLPRISRMKPGATRFTLTDVSGNTVVVVSRGDEDQETWEAADNRNEKNRLQWALGIARRFRDYKNDDTAAIKTLDAALKHAGDQDPSDIAEVLLMRIELAESAEDNDTAAACKAQLDTLGLSVEEIARLRDKHRTVEE